MKNSSVLSLGKLFLLCIIFCSCIYPETFTFKFGIKKLFKINMLMACIVLDYVLYLHRFVII